MNITLWVVAGIVAIAMLAAGASKLTRRRDQLIDSGYVDWAENFSQGQITVLGGAEVLGAFGLILPASLGIAEVLTPLAASGITIIMVGAVVEHLRREERGLAAAALALALLAGMVAALRFGPYGF